MGTELVGPLEDDNMESPLIPPGFESLAPFILNRTEANQISNFSRSASAPEAQSIRLETNYDSNDNLRTSKSVRRRTWVKYNQFDSSSGDESESNQVLVLLNLNVCGPQLFYRSTYISIPVFSEQNHNGSST